MEINNFATFQDESGVAVFFSPLMDTRSITLMGNPFFSFTSNNYFFSGSSDDLKQSKEMISYNTQCSIFHLNVTLRAKINKILSYKKGKFFQI